MTARATVEEEILPGEGAKTETTNGHPQRDIQQLLPCHRPCFRWQMAQAHPNFLVKERLLAKTVGGVTRDDFKVRCSFLRGSSDGPA